jgi:hypothetical protein
MNQIYKEVFKILTMEEGDTPDWDGIRNRSLDLLAMINEKDAWKLIDGILHRYLDDWDIRERDRKYGAWQRSETRRFLESKGLGDVA